MLQLPHSFRTEIKLKSHEIVCKNKDFYGIEMPSEKDNAIEFNEHMKSGKMSCITYADIESLIKTIERSANNPQNSYSISIIWTFDHIEDKHFYIMEYCMKKFCRYLREHAKNSIHFEKKKILPLTKEELKSYQEVKVCYICGKIIFKKLSKGLNYQKLRDHCHYTGKYRGAVHIICNLKFNLPNGVFVAFLSGSN